MKTRVPLAALIALLALTLSAGGASAYYDAVREIDFVESQAWFTSTTTGVGNVDHQLGEYLSWTDEAPTGTSTGMTVATAHAVLIDTFAQPGFRPNGSFTAAGSFTGHLDTIALDLHYDSPTDNLCGMTLSMQFSVDGTRILDMDGLTLPEVVSEPVGDHYVAKVALTNIHRAMEVYNLLGDVDTEHTLEVVATQYPLCTEAIWMYGSTTAPSSLTFNLAPNVKPLKFYTQFNVMNPPSGAS